jgi:hypothetical protein
MFAGYEQIKTIERYIHKNLEIVRTLRNIKDQNLYGNEKNVLFGTFIVSYVSEYFVNSMIRVR